MVKMMVVEDEKILRDGICRVGNWEALEVEICGAAENGREALRKIEDCKPDIILTDVVMPVMDGIEFAGQVYAKYPEIRMIFLSGHEEFEYVKKAMEYKACNYLLKPAKIEKIEEVVAQIRDEILKERERALEEERLHRKLEQSMPVLREHYMNQLLASPEYDREKLLSQFEFLNIDLEIRNIALLICQPDREPEERADAKIFLLQLQEICQNVMGNECKNVVFTDLKDRIVMVVNYPETGRPKEILPYLQGKAARIQAEAEQLKGLSVSLGIGRPIPDMRYLAKAYRDAEYALDYRFFMGNRSVIYIGDIEKEEHRDRISMEQREEELTACIKAGDFAGMERRMEQYFQTLAQCSSGGQDFVYEEITMFAGSLLRELRGKVPEGEQDFLTELEELRENLRVKDMRVILTELQNQIRAVVKSVTEKINQNRALRNEGIIEKAKKYVQQNLSGDVSLITVADVVYVSPNYLSFLFREGGENFKDYVVRAKMQRAEEMMEDGKYSLGQIASALGYKDGRYFSQVYKKYKESAQKSGGDRI